jgi:S1-C subfamily serine protease
VFNANGEVIGVNFAYMAGFSGATFGVSVESLRPLLEEVQKMTLRTPGTGISHVIAVPLHSASTRHQN